MRCIMGYITIIATVVMAAFTGCLWWSTNRLWKTTKTSIELTRQEIISTHHPKLRIHSISLKDTSVIGEKSKIIFSIENTGGSTAHIEERNITFAKLEKLSARLPYSGKDYLDLHIQVPIDPGGEIMNDFLPITDEVNSNIHRLQMAGQVDASDYYFFGYIDYRDDIEIIRRTRFCRRYNIKTKCFAQVENEDYEYSY